MLRQTLREYREVAQLEGTMTEQIKVCRYVIVLCIFAAHEPMNDQQGVTCNFHHWHICAPKRWMSDGTAQTLQAKLIDATGAGAQVSFC